MDLWNAPPIEIVEANTVYSFERRLDKYLKDKPIKYNYQEQIVITTGQYDEIYSDENEELVSQAEGPSLLPEEDI